MYVFLSCVETKKSYRCKASEMYSDSDLFNKSLEYARTLVDDKDIFILSAKHHVLRLSDVIDPYQVTLKDMSADKIREWSEKVIEKMKEKGISFNKKAIFLAGEPYRRHIMDKFDQSECPLEGKRIGVRKGWLVKKIGHKNESLKYYLMDALGMLNE